MCSNLVRKPAVGVGNEFDQFYKICLAYLSDSPRKEESKHQVTIGRINVNPAGHKQSFVKAVHGAMLTLVICNCILLINAYKSPVGCFQVLLVLIFTQTRFLFRY